ncbi:MAG: DUF2442 domain-containing protein [Bacteroidales bacterium]|jgi:hypothetical protein|nr:DUF2442 domain-containing protein [Bacteroidales bacterium]
MIASYKIWFDTSNIYIEKNGIIGYLPLIDNKPLYYASEKERQEYTFSPFGIHWTRLDEDFCFDGFIYK